MTIVIKLTQEEVEFMEGFINFRLILNETGNVSISDKRVCQIFIKILNEIGGNDD